MRDCNRSSKAERLSDGNQKEQGDIIVATDPHGGKGYRRIIIQAHGVKSKATEEGNRAPSSSAAREVHQRRLPGMVYKLDTNEARAIRPGHRGRAREGFFFLTLCLGALLFL